MNLEERVANLEREIDLRSARFEAAQSMLMAALTVVSHDPRFIAAAQAAHNSMTASRLNHTGTSDEFMAAYQEHFEALTPVHLRDRLK